MEQSLRQAGLQLTHMHQRQVCLLKCVMVLNAVGWDSAPNLLCLNVGSRLEKGPAKLWILDYVERLLEIHRKTFPQNKNSAIIWLARFQLYLN